MPEPLRAEVLRDDGTYTLVMDYPLDVDPDVDPDVYPVNSPRSEWFIEHVGGKNCQQRLKFRPRGEEGPDLENLFHDRWKKENERMPGLNGGFGLLEILLHQNEMSPMTQRDATVAAMVIQWLGTNCGGAFIHQVYREYGWEIDTYKKTEERIARWVRDSSPTRPVPEEEEV